MAHSLQTEPHIVPELHEFWDEQLAQAHASLAATPLAEIEANMAPLSRSKGARRCAYVDLSPAGKYDPTHAVVNFLAFANHWGRNAAIRARLLQQSLPEPRRLILFPNNTIEDKDMYLLTPQERTNVARGDFTPIFKRQFRVLEELGIKYIQVIGYSQGGAMGAAALRYAAETGKFRLGPSGLFEPPNVVRRSRGQLLRDFLGASQFSETVNGSAVPAFSELEHTRGGILDNIRQFWMFTKFGRSAALPNNRVLIAGFGRGTFIDDLGTAMRLEPNLRVVIGGGTESRILPLSALHKLDELAKQYPKQLKVLHLHGYGHEVSENLVTYVLMLRAALFPKQ